MQTFDQEDLVDPATVIKEKCAETDCTKYKDRLDECTTRVSVVWFYSLDNLSSTQVQSKNKTTETCFEEILDFYHCVDHCASDKIFKVVLQCNGWHYYGSLVSFFHGNRSTDNAVFRLLSADTADIVDKWYKYCWLVLWIWFGAIFLIFGVQCSRSWLVWKNV